MSQLAQNLNFRLLSKSVALVVSLGLGLQLKAEPPRSATSFQGSLVNDYTTRIGNGSDFGNLIRTLPDSVLYPKNSKDIQKAIQQAASQGKKVIVRGTGGTAYGQALVNEGLVINTNTLRKIKWVSQDAVDVEPGALWSEVVDFTLAQGKTPPVLPDTLQLTVGGTLNAGGIGETSYHFGAQVDQVLELDVVTGTGKLITCSPEKNSELFNMALGSMGQIGVITRARLRVQPAPAGDKAVTVRQIKYKSEDAGLYLKDLDTLAKSEPQGAVGGHLVKGADGSWTYVLEVSNWGENSVQPSWLSQLKGQFDGTVRTISYHDYVHRNTKAYLDGAKAGSLQIPHPYLSFFLSGSAIQPLIADLMANPGKTLGSAKIAIFPELSSHFKMPLATLPQPDQGTDTVYHMRIYRKAVKSGDADHLEMLRLNNVLLEQILNAGGKVYLPFSPLLQGQQIQQQFGQQTLQRLEKMKQLSDPQHVFANSSGLFTPKLCVKALL